MNEFFVFPCGRMLAKSVPVVAGVVFQPYVPQNEVFELTGPGIKPRLLVDTEIVYESSLNREYTKQNPRSATV